MNQLNYKNSLINDYLFKQIEDALSNVISSFGKDRNVFESREAAFVLSNDLFLRMNFLAIFRNLFAKRNVKTDDNIANIFYWGGVRLDPSTQSHCTLCSFAGETPRCFKMLISFSHICIFVLIVNTRLNI